MAAGARDMQRHASCLRLAVLVTAVGSLAAPPALAAPTTVSWPVFIKVQAAPATANRIAISYLPSAAGAWNHTVRDGAGVTTVVTEPPSCYPLLPTDVFYGDWVICPDGSSVEPEPDQPSPAPKGGGEDFMIFLADRNDAFVADSIGGFTVRGGTGRDLIVGNDEPVYRPAQDEEPAVLYWTEDHLYGDQGNDLLGGRQGPDLVSGGLGADYIEGGPEAPEDDFGPGPDDALFGGPGNDKLNAAEGDRDRLIDCGPGKRDRVWLDKIDPKPKRCESVKRRRPTPRELSDEIAALEELGGIRH